MFNRPKSAASHQHHHYNHHHRRRHHHHHLIQHHQHHHHRRRHHHLRLFQELQKHAKHYLILQLHPLRKTCHHHHLAQHHLHLFLKLLLLTYHFQILWLYLMPKPRHHHLHWRQGCIIHIVAVLQAPRSSSATITIYEAFFTSTNSFLNSRVSLFSAPSFSFCWSFIVFIGLFIIYYRFFFSWSYLF